MKTLTINTATKNSLKTTGKNLWTAALNLTGAAAEVVSVAAEVTADTSGFASAVVKDIVPTVKAIATSPIDATASYRAQEAGTSYEEERARILQEMPKTASEATKLSSIAIGSLLSDLLSDDHDNNTQKEEK